MSLGGLGATGGVDIALGVGDIKAGNDVRIRPTPLSTD